VNNEILIKRNINQEDIVKQLNSLINAKDITDSEIKNYIQKEINPSDEEINEKIKKIGKKDISDSEKLNKTERLFKKREPTKEQINYYKLKKQKNNLFETDLEECFTDFKLFWDNATSHISKHTQKVCEYLGLKLHPFPVSCPDYNPIEKGWNNTKGKCAKIVIDDEETLQKVFEEKFHECVENNDYISYFIKLVNDLRGI
jgi:hypothetical protein